MKSIVIGSALIGLGVIASAAFPIVPAGIRSVAGFVGSPPAAASGAGGHGHGHGSGGEEAEEGKVILSQEQIGSAGIQVAPAAAGKIAVRLVAPGVVQSDPDRTARVAGRVVGTVVELRKRLGDMVAKGEVVAILESREVAEARSEYFAARTNLELQSTLYEREMSLWDKRISAENQYLRARTTFTEGRLRVELALQKLQALGLTEQDVAELEDRAATLSLASGKTAIAPVTGLQRYAIRAPISGQIVERLVNVGSPMGGEGESKELYAIADLGTVWIELAVPPSDLTLIKQGLDVAIGAGEAAGSRGRIVFVSPILNPETRSARVIASVSNEGMTWRPGSYVTAKVTATEDAVDIRLPRTALQTIAGEQVVFVRNERGFEKRIVVIGKSDDEGVEIAFGLDAGEQIALTNTFVLKAELGKAEAEHAH